MLSEHEETYSAKCNKLPAYCELFDMKFPESRMHDFPFKRNETQTALSQNKKSFTAGQMKHIEIENKLESL